MSRWYLTSSENADRDARVVCQRARLRSSGVMSGPNCYGQAYFKRVVATPNVAKCGDENWICSAGTIIYNGRLGEAALRDCYLDFVTAGISAVQSKAIGHYAIAIRENNQVTIFTDPQGSLSLYYCDTGSFWFASNSLDVCASALSQRKIDSTKLLVNVLQSSLQGEGTFYSNVKRLFGTQLIRIDLGSGALRVEHIHSSASALSWNSPSMQDSIDQYKQEVRSIFGELTAVGSIGLLGTGGIDSRTVLAALLDQKANLQLMYGVGNSRLTDYDAGDLDIAKALAKLYNFPFLQLDWSGNQPHSEETLQELFRSYGFNYEIHGAPESFLRAFNGGISPYPKLFLGGRGPALSNSKPWELSQACFPFDDLIADGMRFTGGSVEKSRCIVCKAAYRSVIATDVRTSLRCAEMDYPENGASLEAFVKAKLFLYIRADSRFLNFANEFGHYIEPFLMKKLHDPLLSVPLKYRVKDEFQIRLIHSLEPSLIEIPLYAGWSPARIDRDTFRLIRDRISPKQSLVGRIAEKALPSALLEPARTTYRRITHRNKESTEKLSDRDLAIVEAYSREIMRDQLGPQWFNSTSEFTPKILARIRHYLVGVNTLGYSDKQ